jgi:glycine/D-amino acid oxidase-like deaminating enzyme
MTPQPSDHQLDTVVIGGGQAGLAMGYYLAAQHRDFVILDAAARVGQTWRNRWDSLRLFTPAFHSGLPGMPFPAPGHSFPTKDQTADYLEAYASKFQLPLRLGRRVQSLSPHDDRYQVRAGDERYTAEHVVVATGPTTTRTSPASPPPWTRPSPNCTPATTATPPSFPQATCWWSGRATPAPRSPWSWPPPDGPTCPARTSGTRRSGSFTTGSRCGWPTSC